MTVQHKRFPEWTCDYCHDNFHEACLDFEFFSGYGIVKCGCICNKEVSIPN